MTTGERERALSDVDRDERMVANAAGALDVVRASSATVDDQLAAISARTTEQADETAAVVDDDAVPESFAAFYVGSADQVVRARRTGGDWQVELGRSPSGSTGVERTTVAPTAPLRPRETD